MDLSTRVDYEFLYPLDLTDPVTDTPLGIVFQLRSSGSDEAKRVLREHTNKHIERNIKGRKPDASLLEQQELEKVAACIASWDWGQHEWKGSKPALTMKMAIEILDQQAWIYGQVSEAANKIENFTPPSPKPSVDKSK